MFKLVNILNANNDNLFLLNNISNKVLGAYFQAS